MNNKYLTASTVTLFDAETEDDANAMNQLSLRVAKLEEAYQLLLADKPKTTRKHKETTTEATDATPE